MRIPITMFHGINPGEQDPLTVGHFDGLVGIARELGFESIGYDDLEAWRAGKAELPARPIMFDFDHPVRSMREVIQPVLDRHGFHGNLFIHTGPLDEMYAGPMPPDEERRFMTWEEIGGLVEAGWRIGAHTVTHPNLSQLAVDDPSGEKIRAELDRCDATIEQHLGSKPRDFAFTGTSWSSMAERLVKERYRFGRLWIIGAQYQVDGKEMRYADLVAVDGLDEDDGGPPHAARYITKDTDPYRLPSMEIKRLIREPAAFRGYLERALAKDER